MGARRQERCKGRITGTGPKVCVGGTGDQRVGCKQHQAAAGLEVAPVVELPRCNREKIARLYVIVIGANAVGAAAGSNIEQLKEAMAMRATAGRPAVKWNDLDAQWLGPFGGVRKNAAGGHRRRLLLRELGGDRVSTHPYEYRELGPG